MGLRLAGFLDYNFTDNLKSGEKDNPNSIIRSERKERLSEQQTTSHLEIRELFRVTGILRYHISAVNL